jgi:hypothetical protein
MKKLVALVSAMCLAFVFTVGCGPTTPAKKVDKGTEKKVDDKGAAKTPAPTAPEKKETK